MIKFKDLGFPMVSVYEELKKSTDLMCYITDDKKGF